MYPTRRPTTWKLVIGLFLQLNEEVDKEKHISFTYSIKAPSTRSSNTTYTSSTTSSSTSPNMHKISVKRFKDGELLDYIQVKKKMDEIWKQNGITKPYDCLSNIKAILEGEASNMFYTSLADSHKVVDINENVFKTALEWSHIEKDFLGLTRMVFTHHDVLRRQKHWMYWGVSKLKGVSIHKFSSALSKTNNH